MQEKYMVNDILSSVNSSLSNYASAISQSSNPELRQVITQIRNNCEVFQYDLYKMAEQKGFYKPAESAAQSDISQVRSLFAE
ncbi:MAG TPA: spore coat protein [Clostridia bacterium]